MDQQGMVPQAVVDILTAQLTALREELRSIKELVEKLTATIEDKDRIIEDKDRIIEEKNQIILNLSRARFGQSSEKRKYVLSDGQVSMFEIVEDGMIPEDGTQTPSEPEKVVHVAGHTRKPKRTMEELCANLPEEKEIFDLPEEEKVNEQGEPLKCIGIEEIRTELIREPEKVYVKKICRKVYIDPAVERETGESEFHPAPTPAPLIPHSYASESVVTDVIIKKYADALPLYRQEVIWKRLGVELRRGTMANWVITVALIYLLPIWELMKEALIKLGVIHADETVLQVNHEPGRTAQQESRIWAYTSSKRAPYQIRLFWYENSRKGACAKEFLKGFTGVLISDGYSGYKAVDAVIRAGCWAHMRRKWYEAMPKGATVENSKAAVGYEFCNRLFAMEKKIESLSDTERTAARQKGEKKLVEEYYAWVDSIIKPSGKLKEAVTYALNQKEYLCTFLDHGEIEICNNQVENGIRPVAVGRKNWLFCDTQNGAMATTIIYSILESAKANGLNPEKYLRHVLSVLPDRFANNSKRDVSDLLPWNSELKKELS